MADLSDEDLQKFKDFMEMFGDSTPKMKKAFDAYIKNSSDFQKEIKKLNKEVEKGTKGYKDQKAKLDQLEDALEELEDSITDTNKAEKEAEKVILLKMRADLKAQAAVQGLQESIRKATTDMASKFTNGAGTFVKNLQDTTDANALATGILNAGVDVAAAGAHGLGQAAEFGGQAMMLFGGRYVKLAGAALEGFGITVDASTDTVAKFIKFGIDVLGKEVDRTNKAFDKIATTGATFSDGLTGMRDAAGSAGLTVEQFSGVVASNAHNISGTGLGYTETLNKLSKVQSSFAKGTNSTRDQLLKLGFSFEDQANLTLETMNNMRRGGTLAGASNAEIAAQTKEYAENLRVISAITGEDAKKRMEDAKKAMQNTAIQSKLLEMQKNNPEAYAKLQAQLATMPAEMQKMYLQKITLGAVADPVSAVLMSKVPGMRAALEANEAVLNDGTKNAKDAENEAGRQRGVLAKSMADNISSVSTFGKAHLAGIGGLIGDTDTAYASIFDQLQGTTEKTNELARKGVEAQAKAQDDLTKGMINGAYAAQNLAKSLQEKLLPLLGTYVNYTGKILGAFDKMLTDSGVPKTQAQKEQAFNEKGLGAAGGIAGGAFGWGLGAALAPETLGLSLLIPLLTGAAGAYLGGSGGSAIGSAIPTGDGMATGGIASGSTSGYQMQLHGTEAVVPLPDGNRIPVEIKQVGGGLGDKSIKDMLDELKRGHAMTNANLTDLIRVMKDNNSLTSGILQNSY